jgi:hypothetical protein
MAQNCPLSLQRVRKSPHELAWQSLFSVCSLAYAGIQSRAQKTITEKMFRPEVKNKNVKISVLMRLQFLIAVFRLPIKM